MSEYKLDKEVRIGHIHLTVSNMKKALYFYNEILGFEITQHVGGAAFLSAGGYHHHLGINIWSTESAQKPQEGHIGLYHFAILYPNKKELAKAMKRIIDFKYPIEGSADHGVSKAFYLKDPDGNGIELYTDEDKKDWPVDKEGKLKMKTDYLDIEWFIDEYS